MKIIQETPYRFRIAQEGAMRVPGIVFAARSLLPDEQGDMALVQVANVATLPGIVRASYAMPDVHWGYGFPIGGVAATDVDADGVVSPGGVGFDISCGVRLLVCRDLDRDLLQPRIRAVMDHLDRAIPRGVGTHQRNAKLQLTVLLAPPEAVPDLYLHPEHRRRRSRPALRTEFDV